MSDTRKDGTVPSAEEELYSRIWREKVHREPDLSADGDLRVKAALQMMEKGRRMLDIGCGEGTLCKLAVNSYTEMHGVDIAEEAVRIARSQGVIAHRINLNTDPLPYSMSSNMSSTPFALWRKSSGFSSPAE
jgi:2-polyprenyl-3-methyl-5-hydroxy-6-metoxy-1,4-benzoquinol methylase